MTSRQKTKTEAFRQLAWLPIPFFLVAIVVLRIMHLKVEYDSPTLVMVLNFLTRTLACLLITYLVGRSFLVRSAPGLLLLSCGVVIWSASGFVASSSIALNREANFGVAVSNIGIWLAALCHLSGVILSNRSKLTVRPAGIWLGAGYALALGAVGLIMLATLEGWLPVFFVDGQGGTLVRYVVLGSSLAMFTLTAILLSEANRPSLSSFVYWYTLALLLIAVGVLGMMVQLSRASLLNWACRAAQYLSGIYMFIAAIASRRESGAREITLAQTINKPRYRYGVAIVAVLAATALRLVFLPLWGTSVIFLTFFPAVMFAGLYGGLWAGLLATILSALAIDYFFFEPFSLIPINNPANWLAIVVFVLSSIMILTIIERKRQAEDLLVTDRELLKVTLNSLGEGVVATDQEERIIFINEVAANLTGYSQTEAIGEPLEKILYIIDNQTSEPHAKIVSREIFNSLILVTRDLQEIPVVTDSSPIKTDDGVIIGTVTVFQDISEKLKTQLELLRAEKLESLGILAGGIAHDFNNVLAAILANIQLAMVKLKNNADIKPYLMNTVETTRKASNLTKQLLTFSKGGAPIKKDTSLIELIKDTTEFVLRGASTKPEFAIANDLWAAKVDEGQISQVIHNLVLNANQVMPKGGMINISAENLSIEEGTRFDPGNYVKITVKDQGKGIAKENLLKIFDPYFTTKKDGNGLGLTTSYSIIKQHDGYIEVESQEGVGTTFFVYLPASNIAVIQTETQAEMAVTGGVFKILVMDDEEILLNAVGEMLKCYGYQVVLTTDGVKAIELYKQAKLLGEPFDVVIMDLTIPGGMGGQEAIARLHDFDPKIKAIVSSGYATDPIMADYGRFGFTGVVSKPYKIDELNEVLQKVIILTDFR